MAELDLPGLLRRIRRRADLSQRELAEACGVSASVVSHAEAGRRGVPAALLARAAEVAGLHRPAVRLHLPAHCDEVDDGTGKPVHAPECPCGCDLA